MARRRLLGWATGEDRRGEFEEVALVHLDALYRSALRMTQNRAEAEDLVQETYLRGFRSFHRFNPGTNCRAWLFTILRNAFRSRWRRRGLGRGVRERNGGRSGRASRGRIFSDGPPWGRGPGAQDAAAALP